jgi:sigma-B regulation protein RsbU (phosphoserine phosphatase)
VRRVLNEAKGLPLGIDPAAPFNEERVVLGAAELAVLYTDGITEARDAGGELFGVEGVERALASGAEDARAAVRLLTEAVRAHQGAGSASDDQTIVVLEGVE